ncbi:MAG: DNA polymerase III subunit delta [Oscillospiraceae bacterium]|nr:DNA polymerase III subunit delta [Oscillospiraceae bacterium]
MAETNLDRLQSDLKLNSPARFYVFYGEEAYLRTYYLDKLHKLVVENFAEAFNYHRFNADTISLQGVLDSLEALPMMAQRSMLQIDDVNFFAMGEDASSYAKFLGDIPDYCTVVLVYDTVEFKIDRRKKALAELFDKAVTVEFTQPSEQELCTWVGRHLKQQGKRISTEDTQYLIHRSGGAMTTMLSEIGKLAAYVEGETVTREHIDLLVEPVLEAEIWDLTDAVATGRYETALQVLRTLLQKQEEPIPILAAIGSQMRRILTAKRLLGAGRQQQDLMKLCGMSSYPARKTIANANRLPERFCARAVELCLEADVKLKSSFDSPDRVLEFLILELAEEARHA